MEELERLHSHMLYLAHGSEVLGHETFAMRVLYIRETSWNHYASSGATECNTVYPY